MDDPNKKISPSGRTEDASVRDADMEELYRKIQPEMRRPKPGPEAIAAALESAQRLAAEADAENAASDLAEESVADSSTIACKVCGYQNRQGTKFCAMCGVSMVEGGKPQHPEVATQEVHPPASQAISPTPFLEPEMRLAASRPTGNETHHYHHHYHHHYFPGAQEGGYPRAAEPMRDSVRDVAREDKIRSSAAALRGDMSRAEAAVRAITQEWVLACNTKHLDDLLELYTPDALVLRSNYPPIRGAAAVREFFFGALDAGLGEVEIEPLRVDVAGDMAYEAGRCKALIPGSAGKRREERGKYLWVLERQAAGDWKLVADCWSSDLTLTTLESDVPSSPVIKTNVPRK